MLLLQKFNLPSKREIYFDEVEHRYTDDINTDYISVTTLIKLYEIPFDREYWLNNKSEKLGVTKDELSAHWDYLRDSACEKGSKKHSYLEDNVNNFYRKKKQIGNLPYTGKKILEKINVENSDLKITHNTIYNFLIDLIDRGFTLYSEKRVYNAEIGVCGTIDIIAIRENEFFIVDWKTNKKKLEFRSGYYKKRNGVETNIWVPKPEDTFKYVLKNIPYCKGEVYTLQLSLYAVLTEMFGLKCLGLYLWHLMDNADDVCYRIQYRKQDVERMLLHYYDNKTKFK